MADQIITCFGCRHWLKGMGFKLEHRVTIRDGYVGARTYDCMGTGHCEHPDRPRGLTTANYTCRDAEGTKGA